MFCTVSPDLSVDSIKKIRRPSVRFAKHAGSHQPQLIFIGHLLAVLDVCWNARYVAHTGWLSVITEQVEHEVVGSIRVLVVRRIYVNQVVAFFMICEEGGCVGLINSGATVEIGKNWAFNFDLALDSRQCIFPISAKLPNTIFRFVESLKYSRRVCMDRCPRE